MKNFAIQDKTRVRVLLVATIMILFISVSASAQKAKASDYKTLLSKNEQGAQGKNSEMQNLVSNFLPTIYLQNGKVASSDNETAISVETDAASFSEIASLKGQTADVKIIKLRLSDKSELNRTFNMASLNNLPKLKYIYVICPFEAQEGQISNMFTGTISNVTIIYSAAIPN